MKKQFSPAKIQEILLEATTSSPNEVCRRHQISIPVFLTWKTQNSSHTYENSHTHLQKKIECLSHENSELKKILQNVIANTHDLHYMIQSFQKNQENLYEKS